MNTRTIQQALASAPPKQEAQTLSPKSPAAYQLALNEEFGQPFASLDELKLVVQRLSCYIEIAIKENEITLPNLAQDPFNLVRIPDISIKDYLLRFIEYWPFNLLGQPCTQQHLLAMIIYLNRYLDLNTSQSMHSGNVHALICASMILASVYLDDQWRNNDRYFLSAFAKIAGVNLALAKELQSELLSALDYQLYISKADYQNYQNELYLLLADEALEQQANDASIPAQKSSLKP